MRDKIIFLIMIGCICLGILVANILLKIFEKKENNSTLLIRAIKVNIILAGIAFLGFFAIGIVYGEEKAGDLLSFWICLLFAIFFTTIFAGLMMDGKIKPPKPNKYLLKQTDYKEFSSYLSNRAESEYDYSKIHEEENFKVYKRKDMYGLHYLIDLRLEELTQEMYEEYYGKKIPDIVNKDTVKFNLKLKVAYVIMVVSVDKVSSVFYRFVDNADQDLKIYRLPVGVSFGGKKIYITKEIDGFIIPQFKKMKEEICNIMELEQIKEEKEIDINS